MDTSSIIELKNAFNHLRGWLPDGNVASRTVLGWAGLRARNISSIFQASNPALAAGWATVEDFCKKIDMAVQTKIVLFASQLTQFCDETLSNEGQAAEAVNKANEAAAEILKELGL